MAYLILLAELVARTASQYNEAVVDALAFLLTEIKGTD
jgi:hypothetical protein